MFATGILSQCQPIDEFIFMYYNPVENIHLPFFLAEYDLLVFVASCKNKMLLLV